MKELVWLITGCSSGLGQFIAKSALAKGHRVVLTARNPAAIAPLAAEFGDRAIAVALDVCKLGEIDAAIAASVAQFGGIDVLVNNAGYGYYSAIEEGIDAEVRALFDANVFGLFAVTRAVLPLMRQQRSGHIINISSVAGISGFPGSGYYAATKHAVEGFSDSLAGEVRSLGIHVTCAEPGPARTDWAGRSLHRTESQIADYEETAGKRIRDAMANSGRQPGNPALIADLIVEVAEQDKPPRNIAFGARAIDLATRRLQQKIEAIESWSEKGRATDDQ